MDIELIVPRLARGLVEAQDRHTAKREPLREVDNEPASLRRARALLAAACIREGVPDIGSGLHVAMSVMTLPVSEWGVPSLRTGGYASFVLIDPRLMVPTAEAYRLAGATGSEADAKESIHYAQLMQCLLPTFKEAGYSKLRRFLAEHPSVSTDELLAFQKDSQSYLRYGGVDKFYRSIPEDWLMNGRAWICQNCRSVTKHDRRSGRYCLNPSCSSEIPVAWAVECDPTERRTLHPELIEYWAGPGYDEIRLHDALKGAGLKVQIYPNMDEVDISIDGRSVGIDVKNHSSPVRLGGALASPSSRKLERYDRAIIAVPDRICGVGDHYLTVLSDSYADAAGTSPMTLEFRRVSDIVREFVR